MKRSTLAIRLSEILANANNANKFPQTNIYSNLDSTVGTFVKAEQHLFLRKLAVLLASMRQDDSDFTVANSKDIDALLKEHVDATIKTDAIYPRSIANIFCIDAVGVLFRALNPGRNPPSAYELLYGRADSKAIHDDKADWVFKVTHPECGVVKPSFNDQGKTLLIANVFNWLKQEPTQLIKLFSETLTSFEDRKNFLKEIDLGLFTQLLLGVTDQQELKTLMQSLPLVRAKIHTMLNSVDAYGAADRVNAVWFLALELSAKHRDVGGDHLSTLGWVVGRPNKQEKDAYFADVQRDLCGQKSPKVAMEENANKPEHVKATSEWLTTFTYQLKEAAEKVCAEGFFAAPQEAPKPAS
jgi:hypothetical protein